jgi:hypothetical protein
MWSTEWNEKASLRWLNLCGPESVAQHGERNFFSPQLVRVNAHPLVQRRGHDTHKRLQRRHLYRYLAATEAIEIEMVNPALRFVMASPIAPDFALDAYKVYTDEGFHALMCTDLRRNLAQGDMPYLLRYRSSALEQTLALTQVASREDAELILLVIACVNETMIAASLSQATDASVYPALRELVMAHARDEASHNVYFSGLLTDVFPRLSRREQSLLRELMPDIFQRLHLSDLDGVRADLAMEGFDADERDLIVHETFEGPVDHAGMRRVCASSLHMLRRCGHFNDADAREAFVAAGLGYLLQKAEA